MLNHRNYVQLDKKAGFPVSKRLFIECMICGEAVKSLPEDSIACKCRNITIDTDAGRVDIEHREHVRFFTTENEIDLDKIPKPE